MILNDRLNHIYSIYFIYFIDIVTINIYSISEIGLDWLIFIQAFVPARKHHGLMIFYDHYFIMLYFYI